MSVIQLPTYDILVDELPVILNRFISGLEPSQTFILVDENTVVSCLPRLTEVLDIEFHVISIKSGEQHKSIETCLEVWTQLSERGCDRHSLMINLGGGVVTDLGGFVASTYMRGISFINVPTTLLAQVDASIGGKTGVDLHRLKNHIGLFRDPALVWIETRFLESLDNRQRRSGYAEVIKHALVGSEPLWRYIIERPMELTAELVSRAIMVKKQIVEEDPHEQGIRKILNFGHTVGHALESFYMEDDHPLLHGEAVAHGMLAESWLSHRTGRIAEEIYDEVAELVRRLYPVRSIIKSDYSTLLMYMSKDKKNVKGNLSFSLLTGIGHCEPAVVLTDQEAEAALAIL